MMGQIKSDVPYIPYVPENWDTLQTRYCFDIKLGKMIQNEPSSETDEHVPYLKAVNVNWLKVDSETDNRMWASPSQIRNFGIAQGDLLISEGGDVGRSGMVESVPEKCIIQNALHRVRSKYNSYNKFLYYYMSHIHSSGWFDILCNKATIAHLTFEKLGSLQIAIPPLETQKQIADFLDNETTRIDTLITKKQRQIELLQEKRQAIITQAVTKGLNPDVKMKDSGVEWIGEIPEHWETLPIKRLVSIPVTDGPHETPEFLDEGIPFVSAESVRNNKINFNKKRGYISIEEHHRFSKKYKPQLHDVYMIKSGATTGNCAIVETEDEFNIWSPLAVIRANQKILHPFFILYSLNSKFFQTQVQLGWSYGTQQNIGMNIIENLPITVPPIKEQKRIVEYLNQEIGTIEELNIKIEKSIDLLKEYRSSLITHAVSGQIDISEYEVSK